MRTVSADNEAILAGRPVVAFRIQVKDDGGTFRDLTTYPGIDLVEDLSWSEDIESPGVAWSATLTREQESVSLAPFMSNSPLNRGFDPAALYAALVQVGRRMKVEYSMQAEDDPRTRTWDLAFDGYIDSVDSGGGDNVKLAGRGLEATLINCFIQRERVYAFAQGGFATKGCYIWTPSTVWAVGDRIIPTHTKLNAHFYRVTVGGTGGATEPAWPTSGTIADGGATFTESGATSTSTGTAVETVIQQILDDNLGAGVVTLWCPTSPAWLVQWFLVSRQPTFTELKALADQIGWCLRYMIDPADGTSKLKLFDPLRSSTISLRAFGPTQVADVRQLKTDWQGIRNKIRVIYSDSQDLDAGSIPKRKTIDVTDSASVTKYGELFAELAEASGSNIDTSAEATTLANAVLSDLAEPTADIAVDLIGFFAFVEVCDIYTLSANSVHFDSAQKLAVSNLSHHVSAAEQTTSFRLRGKPASNGKKGWFERLGDAGGAEQHQLVAMENFEPILLAADTTPVGGTRINFTWGSARNPKDAKFEFHLSLVPGFTPSAATLIQSGSTRSADLGHLDPAKTYYSKVNTVVWNGQKPVRGEPSAEISFVPGRGQATHLNPNVVWGRLPLNGGFETQFDTNAPPDFWYLSLPDQWNGPGATGGLVTLGTAAGVSGANYLKLRTTNTIAGVALYSAEFTVTEIERYIASVIKKNVSGSGTNLDLAIAWYDLAHAYLSSTTVSFSLSADVGLWKSIATAALVPPAGARFARMNVAIQPGANGREVHVDSVDFALVSTAGASPTDPVEIVTQFVQSDFPYVAPTVAIPAGTLIGVKVVETECVTTPGQVVDAAVDASQWSQSGRSLTLNYVSGLTVGVEYRLHLELTYSDPSLVTVQFTQAYPFVPPTVDIPSGAVTGVKLVKTENITTPDGLVYDGIDVSQWSLSGTTLTLNEVTGLTIGVEYRLTLEVATPPKIARQQALTFTQADPFVAPTLAFGLGTPTGIKCVRTVCVTTPGQLVYDAVDVSQWSYAAGTITFNYVSALTVGAQYTLTLEVSYV